MTGVSLSPRIFIEDKRTDVDQKLINEFGGTEELLRFLKGLGVSHIELRSVGKKDDPSETLSVARTLWDFGFELTVHASLPGGPMSFSESCPSLLPLLTHAKKQGSTTVITVHSAVSGDDGDKSPAAKLTNRILKLWSSEAETLGFKIALEINRDKHNGDPSVTCGGVLDMLEGTDPGLVGICFDFGHYYSNVLNCGASESPSEEFLRRVIHTHIHALADGKTHFPIDSTTELPLRNYTDALIRAGYNGVFNFEPDFPRYVDLSFREAIRSSVLSIKGEKTASSPFSQVARSAYAKAMDSLYPEELSRIAKEIENEGTDCFWTLGPSSQFFSINGIKFAVDPAIRSRNASAASLDAMARILKQADFILITHSHDDHFDPELAGDLRDLPCPWVFGSNFPKEIIAASKLNRDQIKTVCPGEKISLGRADLTAFNGSHFSSDGSGVPAVMYLLNAGGKTIFFPADVRDYGADKLPAIPSPDIMFANVWLGRKQALSVFPGAYEEFCDYLALYRPKKVFLGHLYEYTRTPGDMWRYEHAGRIMDGLALRLPGIPAIPLLPFCRYCI